jgi:hypothetical protein
MIISTLLFKIAHGEVHVYFWGCVMLLLSIPIVFAIAEELGKRGNGQINVFPEFGERSTTTQKEEEEK